jgi:hypothetical protein
MLEASTARWAYRTIIVKSSQIIGRSVAHPALNSFRISSLFRLPNAFIFGSLFYRRNERTFRPYPDNGCGSSDGRYPSASINSQRYGEAVEELMWTVWQARSPWSPARVRESAGR